MALYRRVYHRPEQGLLYHIPEVFTGKATGMVLAKEVLMIAQEFMAFSEIEVEG